jgi:hypothetical protein
MRISAALFCVPLLACSSAPPARVTVRTYLGKENTYFLDAAEAGVSAIVMPETGGRVVRYARGQENILWQNEDAQGLPRAGGGFQLDIGPEMRQIPRHEAIWSGRYQGAVLGGAGVRVASAPDPAVGLQVFKEFGLDARNGQLEVVGRMRNVTQGEVSYCFWDRTLCKPGGWTLVPVGAKSRFKAGWVLGRRVPGKESQWSYDGDAPSHESMKLLDGVLVVKTGGKEQKCGTDAMAGWIAYAKGTLLFVKYFPCFPEGKYTDGGMTVAHYYSERISELEPLSPEVTLKAGADYVFPQMWVLIPIEKEPATFEEARALAAKIPPSPFPQR